MIKSTDTGRRTPVIAVTASAFDDSEEQTLAEGMDGFVSKPFKPADLFAVLGKALSLQYRFAESRERESPRKRVNPWSLTPRDLEGLPEVLMAAMRKAVENGEMDTFNGLIVQDASVSDDVGRVAGDVQALQAGVLLGQFRRQLSTASQISSRRGSFHSHST